MGKGATERGFSLRAMGIAAWLMLMVAGQTLAVVYQTGRLWPFNPISVYEAFSSDRAISNEAYLVGPDGEIRVPATGLADHRIVLRFVGAVYRASTKKDRDHIAGLFFDYVRGRSSGAFRYTGLRMYRRSWDLERARAVESQLLAEYSKP
jgi:hypothetical protein